MKKQQNISQSKPDLSKASYLWMMAGMIALELNSVTRIHNECIRFLSLAVGEMPAPHHNPEFRFSILNHIMSLITNHVRVHFSKCSEMYIQHGTCTWDNTNNVLMALFCTMMLLHLHLLLLVLQKTC